MVDWVYGEPRPYRYQLVPGGSFRVCYEVPCAPNSRVERLVLRGDDEAHPRHIARITSRLYSSAQLLDAIAQLRTAADEMENVLATQAADDLAKRQTFWGHEPEEKA